MYIVFALFFFFFNDTATTEIYTLSLHDALPIFQGAGAPGRDDVPHVIVDVTIDVQLEGAFDRVYVDGDNSRSEEHTSELQSPCNLVCRLLLEKKKKQEKNPLEDVICRVVHQTAN